MIHMYEAHPLMHAGEPELTVEFSVPDGLTPAQQNEMFDEASEEVKRRVRTARIVPPLPVVFSSHELAPSESLEA